MHFTSIIPECNPRLYSPQQKSTRKTSTNLSQEDSNSTLNGITTILLPKMAQKAWLTILESGKWAGE